MPTTVARAVGGMQWAFGVGAVLSVAVLVLAFLLPGRPAAPVHPVEQPADDEVVQAA